MKVPYLSLSAVKAADVPQQLDQAAVEWHPIDQVNWPAYPYQPKVEVRIAHTGQALLLHYRVEEETVRAVAQEDNGRVWEDSCCEFFSQMGGDDIYYNVECNCAGRVLLCAGKEREGRQRADYEHLQLIDRWSSLGNQPFEEQPAPKQWQLALVIPAKAFFLHHIEQLNGRTVKANCYKCGDKLKTPHFLSLFPIAIEKPDFHRPDFFGQLEFDN